MTDIPQVIETLDSFSLSSLGAHMIFDEINEVTSYKTAEFLLKANILLPKDDAVTLFINSPGGSVTDGWAIIDVMEASRVDIQTVALGMIASMAVNIFIAGTKGKRIMTPKCAIMTHQFSSMIYGKAHELLAARKFHDTLEKQFIEHFMRHTNMTAKQIKEILLGPSDTWLEPKECLKYGICDVIKNPWDIKDDSSTKKPRRKKTDESI